MTLLSRWSKCTAFRSRVRREGEREGGVEDEDAGEGERVTSILKSPPEDGREEGEE